MDQKITYAITRKPGPNFCQGITTAGLGEPYFELVMLQHSAYVRVLRDLGVQVVELEPFEDFPDGCFVEDTALVIPETAIMTRPGAESRRREVDAMRPVLSEYKKIEEISPSGTVDGGDVLNIGSHFFIGLSDRTNMKGAQILGAILEKYRKTWSTVPVDKGLHLKSGVNYVGYNTLLMTGNYSEIKAFHNFQKIIVDKNEAYAANTLYVNNHLIMPSGFPDTRKKLLVLKMPIVEVDMSEARKMDGGLTCFSIRF